MKRWAALLVLLLVLGGVSPGHAQQLRSKVSGLQLFRIKATNLTTSKLSDSTIWIPFGNVRRASVQYYATDTFPAVDSCNYTIVYRWSNNGITPVNQPTWDSLSPKGGGSAAENVYYSDTIICRPYAYIKFVIKGNNLASWKANSGGAKAYIWMHRKE